MTMWSTTDDAEQSNAWFVGPDMLRDVGLLEAATPGYYVR